MTSRAHQLGHQRLVDIQGRWLQLTTTSGQNHIRFGIISGARLPGGRWVLPWSRDRLIAAILELEEPWAASGVNAPVAGRQST